MRKFLKLFPLYFGLCACQANNYMQIETKEAARMMASMEEEYVLLDVRTIEEFKEGYIEGAINIPLDEIEEKAKSVLLNKNQPIFVYCRSGNRSKTASEKLCDLGYTHIIEMGGIIDWEGNVVK